MKHQELYIRQAPAPNAYLSKISRTDLGDQKIYRAENLMGQKRQCAITFKRPLFYNTVEKIQACSYFLNFNCHLLIMVLRSKVKYTKLSTLMSCKL